MAYLEPSEYEAYGLSVDTSDAWVAAASSMIDAHCRRSSLLSGLYTERLRVSRNSGTVQLTYGPVISVSAVRARQARPDARENGMFFEYALTFGLPGQWTDLDPASVAVDAANGELQLPCNLLGFRYDEIEVTYTAGLNTVPPPIKFACAQVVKNAQSTPGLNVKTSKLDTLQTEYFSDSLLDSGVKLLLRPFVAERLG